MELINIAIYSDDKNVAEEFINATVKEAIYFKELKEKIIIINDIQELKEINDIEIFIYLISKKVKNNLKKYSYEELKDNSNIIIILDEEKGTIQNNEYIRNIQTCEDYRTIIFSILYDYYKKIYGKWNKRLV